jgi:phenylpropionate dioxygenase-like ring-hydroxylating dioxygenase large terminal subunit
MYYMYIWLLINKFVQTLQSWSLLFWCQIKFYFYLMKKNNMLIRLRKEKDIPNLKLNTHFGQSWHYIVEFTDWTSCQYVPINEYKFMIHLNWNDIFEFIAWAGCSFPRIKSAGNLGCPTGNLLIFPALLSQFREIDVSSTISESNFPP